MSKRIVVIQGHPDSRDNHLGFALSEAYAVSAREAGHEVRVVNVGQLEFPMIRSKFHYERSDVPQELHEPQHDLLWADHWALFYPIWLGDMPAVLKGFFEQVLRKDLTATQLDTGERWEKILAGKSARIVVTMATPAAVYRLFYGAHTVKSLERNILKYCGISPVRTTLIGSVYKKSKKQLEKNIAQMRPLGIKGI